MDLPDEMWLIIFTFVEKRGDARLKGLCMQVCKQWRHVYQEPSFWVTKFFDLRWKGFPISEEELASGACGVHSDVVACLDEFIVFGSGLRARVDPLRRLIVRDAKERLVLRFECTTQNWPASTDYIVELESPDSLDNGIVEIYGGLFLSLRSPLMTQIDHPSTLFNREEARMGKWLKETVTRLEATLPVWENRLWQAPPLIRVPLHRYQLEAMSWMHWVEHHPRQLSSTSDIAFGLAGDAGLRFRRYGQAGRHLIKDSPAYTPLGQPFCGGVLADSMGLGKTLTTIAASLLARPAMPQALFAPDDPVHSHFRTRATLVVVPNQLPGEWAREIASKCGDAVRVVTLTTQNDHVKRTYRDVMEADFVIVTSNFLVNPNHYKRALPRICGGLDIPISSPTALRVPEAVRAIIHSVLAAKRAQGAEFVAQESQPLLELFHWPRVVVDEVHSVLAVKSEATIRHLFHFFDRLTSDARWALSGTPFPTQETLWNVVEFVSGVDCLHEHKDRSDRGEQTNAFHYSVATGFVRECVWRNTKEGIRDMFTVPPIRIQACPLELHSLELAIYRSYETDHNRRLFCTHGLSSEKAFDLGRLEKLRQERLVALRAALDRANAEATSSSEGLSEVELDLTEALEGTNLDPMSVTAAELPHGLLGGVIHLSIVSRDLLQEEYEIAVAKLVRLSNTLVRLHDLPPLGVTDESSLVERLHAAFGTKMTGVLQAIIRLLDEDPTHRVLLFSTSPAMLDLAAFLLREFGIEAQQMGASVHSKAKALREFRADGSKSRVLLLNTGTTAAGTNLVQATHVILMDPPKGSASESTATEQQAIGRAYRQGQTKSVQVLRFYLRDTIEEDTVRANAKV